VESEPRNVETEAKTESEMTSQTLSPPELNTLQIEIDGEIGTLTLNRPDAFNAMSPEMIGEMTVAFAWLADRAPLRALIVTGAGKAFCAGGDVTWFQKGVEADEIDLPSEVRRGAEALHAAIVDLRRIPYPVIAAINGPAAGAGFSLALACDTRIASESAFLACAYGRIGASPDGGMTYFLPRVVGPSRALELLLEDPNLTAEQALAEGLVREVVAPEELMEAARAKAEKLAAKAPHYVRMSKLLCGVSIENSLTEHLQLERHGIADSMATEDLRQGVVAFFGGEKPEFHGR
jgi:2-(1,2-epoxy-1,2-dihydrophenyl)acetyl-CoA isomerase